MQFENILLPLLLTVLAGLSTVLGSLIYLSSGKICKENFVFFLGMSAGVMIYLSLIEFLPEGIKIIGLTNANLVFVFGIACTFIIDKILPQHHIECQCSSQENKALLKMGLFVAVALALHNLPEGIVVFVSSLKELRVGVYLAIAIAIHNIPEGIAISAPIYEATKNKFLALKYSFYSALAEPIGAIMAYLFFGKYLNDYSLGYIYAFVAGVMIFISFDELLPTCFKHKKNYSSIAGILFGFAVVAFSLSLQ